MRLVIISDTHGLHDRMEPLPDGDVLIHAGDVSNVGRPTEIKKFTEWFNDQTFFQHRIWIGGNHDWALQHFMEAGEEKMIDDISRPAHYLRDRGICIDGVNFYGSPWQPTFCDWAFNLNRGRWLKEKWDLIPANTDVLITHGPPMGILDHVGRERVGCWDLMNRVMEVKPKVHCFGHIHCAYGQAFLNGTTYINAAVCTEVYKPQNAPTVVDI